MSYHGGRVMHTTAVHAIYWVPSGYSVSSGYQGLIDGFLADVAAASGTTGNVWASDTQYTDTTTGHITYSVSTTVPASYVDTNPFPNTGVHGVCTADQVPCITDDDVVNELNSLVNANGWPHGNYNDLYLIMLPSGLNECIDMNVCSTNTFCAYHGGYGTLALPTLYAVEPYFDIGTPGCDAGQHPNADAADIAINTLSHEINEAITDPVNAWYDAAGWENGDKCAWNFGTRIGHTGSGQYNQLINGHGYYLQREWSNASNGCYQFGAPTIGATGISPLSAPAGATVSITGTNFFAADGTTPIVRFNGHASPSVAVNGTATVLTATVPAGSGMNGKITVQSAGGQVVSAQTFGVPPVIDDVVGVAPTSGQSGATITITGTGFFGVTSVKFNGVAGSFNTVATNGTSLHAIVPAAATSGPITVTTTGGVSAPSAQTFTVLPKVTSFTPLAAPANGVVTITGTGLGAVLSVSFVGHSGVFVDGGGTATTVRVHVPDDARTGQLTLASVGLPDVTTTASFKPLPRITGIAPSDGPLGQMITISGTNLLDVTSVKFGAVAASSILPGSATSLTVGAPLATFSSGTITVVTAGGTTTSTQSFGVTKISSFSPASAAANTLLTITGVGLASTTGVEFAGHSGAVTPQVAPTATSVKVLVPDDATVGPVEVDTAQIPGGLASTTPFKPLPKITSFTPHDGSNTQVVTITGTNLLGATAVKFGALPAATFGSVTATQITATVPAASTFTGGLISVTTPGGTGTSSAPFALTKITGISPIAAVAGTTLTVTGAGLGSVTAVHFSGHADPVAPSNVTATSFRVVVPDDATADPLVIDTSAPVTGLIGGPVFKPLPKLSVDSTSHHGGDVVVIGGSNLAGATALKLGARTLLFLADWLPIDATHLSVTIPNDAVSATLTVTTGAGTATSPTPLKIAPTPGSPDASDAVTGAILHFLNGANFTGTTSVKFAGTAGAATVPASFTVVSPTALNVTVPATAVTGAIQVTNAGGSTSTGTPFTVDPKITSFTPTSGPTGTLVTLNGTGFGAAADTRQAGINFATGPVTYVSPTMVRFTVPNGSHTGPVALAVNGTPAVVPSTQFTVSAAIENYTQIAPYGADVEIDGPGLGGVTSVSFNGVSVPVVTNTGTVIHVTLPSSGNLTGPITLTASGHTITAPGLGFLLLTATAHTPALAKPGDTLTVDGTGFASSTVQFYNGAGTDATAIGTTVASTINAEGTQLTVTVPASFSGGSFRINALGDATRALTVPLAGLSLWAAPAGGTVRVTMEGLPSVSSVLFGAGTPAPASTPVVGGHVDAFVPADAATGHVTVNFTTGDPFVSSSDFVFQVSHANGLGQHYLSGAALGTPGVAGTYTQAMALAAAAAWLPQLGAGTTMTCTGGISAVVKTSATQAAVWAYSGTTAGHVFLNSTTTALCPAVTDPTWD